MRKRSLAGMSGKERKDGQRDSGLSCNRVRAIIVLSGMRNRDTRGSRQMNCRSGTWG